MNEENQNQTIAYGGHCAFAMSLGKKEVMGEQKYSFIKNGKTYLFSNPVAKLLFRIFPGRENKVDSNFVM
jgi:YHS domain-containing protein